MEKKIAQTDQMKVTNYVKRVDVSHIAIGAITGDAYYGRKSSTMLLIALIIRTSQSLPASIHTPVIFKIFIPQKKRAILAIV